jgi:hypothetical protein
MNQQEAREWRQCPIYRGFEKFRAKRNINGEYEVLSENGLLSTYKPEDFHANFQKAAQFQVAIKNDEGKVTHYESRAA